MEKRKYVMDGINSLREGKVALIILAGGQSTRMGTDIVNGTIDIGLPSGRTAVKNERSRKVHLPTVL